MNPIQIPPQAFFVGSFRGVSGVSALAIAQGRATACH